MYHKIKPKEMALGANIVFYHFVISYMIFNSLLIADVEIHISFCTCDTSLSSCGFLPFC